MDWSNERYVRLFTRNTTTWRRLGWDGQNALMHLLRVVDRAGVLDIQDMTPAEAVSLHTGAPEDAAARGISKMLELGVVIHAGGRLIFPNFLTAQECPMSDKLRAKVSREKRALSHSDTAPSRDVTNESRKVTESHAESPTVTPSHSASQRVTLLPSRSDPTLPNPSLPDPAEPGVTAAAAEVGDPIRAKAMRGRKRLRAVAENLDSDHGGKWQHAFATLSEKPEAEWTAAAAVLIAEAQRPGAARKLTPQHILDYWSTYAAGEAPGPGNGPKRAGGMAPVMTEADALEMRATPLPAWRTRPLPEDA